MNRDQAKELLLSLGSKQVKAAGDWVTGTCPLAPWRHKSGKDTNPSFGVSTDSGKRSHYHCFSCSSGSVSELIQSIQFYHQKNPIGVLDFKRAFQILDQEDLSIGPLPEYQEFPLTDPHVFTPWNTNWLDEFEPLQVHMEAMAYVQLRGVTPTQMWSHGLEYDPIRRMIVFPYWNVYGQFAGARGRSIDSDTEGWQKHYDYTQKGINNSRLVWYNEQALNLVGPTVVVEGQIDCLKVLQVYPKCIANLTAKPTPQKLQKLMQSSRVLHIPDNDQAGDESVGVYAQACVKGNLPYKTIRLPPEVKDCGECHPEFLHEFLNKFI